MELDTFMCVRHKEEDLCWMPVVFGPSDDTASLIGINLSLTLLNAARKTSTYNPETSRNNCR